MIPRIIIAGAQSGVGKTTVAVGLMNALARRGLRVQGFKAGPDYVDSQCHRWATGRPGRNLDTWLMTPQQVLDGFSRGTAWADIAVIEGKRGLYDGIGGTDETGSTAHLAKVLQAPVVLVLDAAASARSIAAVALGFKLLDPAVPLVGVICNQVSGERHTQTIREALNSVGIPLLGALMGDRRLRVPEDRMGLVLPGGEVSWPQWIAQAGDAVTGQVDLDQVLALATAAPAPAEVATSNVLNAPAEVAAGGGPAPTVDPFAPSLAGRFKGLRLGVPLDEAFWFYYPDTFDLLTHWGVKLVYFSPLRDQDLPEKLHGLYLGGGFPERHGARLAANGSMLAAVQAAAAAGMPILAEGGGYLYLLEELPDETGEVYAMAGVLRGLVRLQSRPQGVGYRTAQPGNVRGHLFHYTRVEASDGPPAWQLHLTGGGFERADGGRRGSLLASYLHVHHATQPAVMEEFLSGCLAFKAAAR
ncbi:MAG TPA: cobyrinate a,c-diamide synthase [Symbiobacteriaceae bacterium]|jgi:cobyrinic acid a,c-diamide synthase